MKKKKKKASHICGQSWWRHQMDIFSMSVFLCERNPTVTGGFPHQGQWRATSMFSLICTWTNGSANNQDAGGVRRHGAHYDVTVMVCIVDEVQYPNSSEWVNEWISLMVFLVQRGACNSYTPCNHGDRVYDDDTTINSSVPFLQRRHCKFCITTFLVPLSVRIQRGGPPFPSTITIKYQISHEDRCWWSMLCTI